MRVWIYLLSNNSVMPAVSQARCSGKSGMSGLRRICKLYGGMTIQGEKWLWDYVADEPVLEVEMPIGSNRRTASEKAKADLMRNAQQQTGHQTNKG